ncbi:hypothetical protein [Carboxylicivirga sp. RSCT41]|uniref:hypothetical protein n=1 Tax=Carboxylicivirga agarovorans TaxID=3417570 RepID=UPI003D330EF7
MRKHIYIFGIIMVLMGCSKSEDPNMAPDQPVNLLPADGETCESLRPIFSWDASDPEEDVLTYTLWLGTTESDLNIEKENLENSRYSPSNNLSLSTKYYWQVEAHDGTSSTKSEIVSFATMGEGESGVLPSRPILIAPQSDQAAGNLTFSWNASSEGEGSITYDLYAKQGSASAFELLRGDISGTSHTANMNAGMLSWYVEAIDSRGQMSRSAVITISLN